MANFKVIRWNFSSSINLFFLKSGVWEEYSTWSISNFQYRLDSLISWLSSFLVWRVVWTKVCNSTNKWSKTMRLPKMTSLFVELLEFVVMSFEKSNKCRRIWKEPFFNNKLTQSLMKLSFTIYGNKGKKYFNRGKIRSGILAVFKFWFHEIFAVTK